MTVSWCQQHSLMSSGMVCTDPPAVVQCVYCALTTASTPMTSPPPTPHSNSYFLFFYHNLQLQLSPVLALRYQKNLEMKALL